MEADNGDSQKTRVDSLGPKRTLEDPEVFMSVKDLKAGMFFEKLKLILGTGKHLCTSGLWPCLRCCFVLETQIKLSQHCSIITPS